MEKVNPNPFRSADIFSIYAGTMFFSGVFLEYPSSDRGHLSLCYSQAKYTKHFDAASRSVAGVCVAMTKSWAPLGKERFEKILFMILSAKLYP